MLKSLKKDINCDRHLFTGKIIFCSDISDEMAVKVENGLYVPLTADEVKARAITDYSEEDLRHYLESVPQFYKYKLTSFTDLGK